MKRMVKRDREECERNKQVLISTKRLKEKQVFLEIVNNRTQCAYMCVDIKSKFKTNHD